MVLPSAIYTYTYMRHNAGDYCRRHCRRRRRRRRHRRRCYRCLRRTADVLLLLV